MRRVTAIALLMCISTQVQAFEIPSGYQKIGGFRGAYDANPLSLVSLVNPDIEFSDLRFVAYPDQNQEWVKSFTVQATAGIDTDGNPTGKLFSVEFDENPTTKDLEVARVILVDQTWDTPLVADLASNYGAIRIQNLSFEHYGKITFDLSATLLRLNFDQYMPLPNNESVTLKGHYTGTFPAFALHYPFIDPDD